METFTGDPSLKSGNGIPSRCVYLEEMAVELEEQDWLDMSNVEQVPSDCAQHGSHAESCSFSPRLDLPLPRPLCVAFPSELFLSALATHCLRSS